MLACVLGAGLAVWYRTTYWVWPGQGASDRVHWCGRDYQRSGVTWTRRQIAVNEPWPVHVVAQFPPLAFHQESLLAATNPAEAKLPVGTRVSSCATLLYVPSAPGRYVVYSLLGGP